MFSFFNKSVYGTSGDIYDFKFNSIDGGQIELRDYKNKVILIDRFIDSTIAYQHYGMDLD